MRWYVFRFPPWSPVPVVHVLTDSEAGAMACVRLHMGMLGITIQAITRQGEEGA